MRSVFWGGLVILGLWSTAEAETGQARLHSQIVVRGDVVRLSDVFSDLEPGQDCDLGPAPGPGKQVVVPPSQLAAIASEFGVNWQPGNAYLSAVIKRPGRTVGRDEVLAVIRPALLGAGAPADGVVTVAAFVSPELPIEATAPPEVQSLDYDARSGRFSAVMQAASVGADEPSWRIVGRVEEETTAVVSAHALPAGAVLAGGDLQITQIPSSTLHGTPLGAITDAAGWQLTKQVGPGIPLTRDMLVRPILIDRGRAVILRLQSSGLTITAAGIALEGGAAGDRVHVVNSLSHAILAGQIIDAADVEVDPGTAPVIGKSADIQNGLPQAPSRPWIGIGNGSDHAQGARYQ